MLYEQSRLRRRTKVQLLQIILARRSKIYTVEIDNDQDAETEEDTGQDQTY